MNRTPLQQLAAWIDDAQAARLAQPDVMTLATASADGVPSARIVLLTAWTTAAPRWDWSAPSPRSTHSALSAASMPNTASRFSPASARRVVYGSPLRL